MSTLGRVAQVIRSRVWHAPSTVRLEETEALEFLALLRRDWAVRVLDAWAHEHDGWARSWESCERPGSCWVILNDGGQQCHLGDSPDAARMAAAQAVSPTLPDAIRAELGECP